MSDDKNLKSGGRDLPPLASDDSAVLDESEKSQSTSNGSGAKIVKRVVIGFGVFVLLVVIVAVLMFATSESVSEELPKSALDVAGEAPVLEGVNPLLLESEASEGGAFLPVVVNKAEEVEEVVSEREFELDQLSDVLRHLKVIDIRLEMLETGTVNLSEQVILERALLTAEIDRGDVDAKRIEVLEAELAALVKEVKRLKWKERQNRVARKKVKEPEFQVKSFFIWQYRPGVEIELSSGVSERFYEGDLLNGMRLIHIDVNNEAVTLSKGAKRIVLKKQDGA